MNTVAAPTAADSWERAPWLWRMLLRLSLVVVPLLCRVRISGQIPSALRRGRVILAGNHIGIFDPIVLTYACAKIRFAPRILATSGLLSAPGLGAVLSRCGHIGVDRHRRGGQAMTQAETALRAGEALVVYPEGRVTLVPDYWPERGKTGVARLAHATNAPIIPVAQWGAQQLLAYHGIAASLRRLVRALWRRPTVYVHFGDPIELSQFPMPRAAGQAADYVMRAIRGHLTQLRAQAPAALPNDPTRPVSSQRALPT